MYIFFLPLPWWFPLCGGIPCACVSLCDWFCWLCLFVQAPVRWTTCLMLKTNGWRRTWPPKCPASSLWVRTLVRQPISDHIHVVVVESVPSSLTHVRMTPVFVSLNIVSWRLRSTERRRTRMTTWTTWWGTWSHASHLENLILLTLSLFPVSAPPSPTRTQTSWVPPACWRAASSVSPPWSALAATTVAFFATCRWAWSWSSSCCTTWCPGSRADKRRVGL